MTFYTKLKGAALALGFILSGAAVQATPVDFTVTGDTSVADASLCFGCSIDVSLASGLVGTSFSLSEGDSEVIDFFDLTINAGGFISGGLYGVAADLAFDPPGGSISALGGGAIVNAFFSISAGALVWIEDEFTVAFGNGGLYTVSLEQGVDVVLGTSRTILATVTLDAAPVPLPASAVLLFAGLGGLGVMRARRKVA